MQTAVIKLITVILISGMSLLAKAEPNTTPVNFAIGEWPPYTSEKTTAYLESVVEEIFVSQGYEVEFNYYPWKRSYEKVRLGESVATFPWFIDTDRKDDQNFFISDQSITDANEVFFYRKDQSFDWQTYSDLKHLRIGGVVGYSHVTRLKKHGLDVNLVSSENQMFLMLAAGRLDIVPANQKAGWHIIKQHFPKDKQALLTFHAKPLMQDSMHIFFSRQHFQGKHLVEVFDKGMKQLKASGRYQELADKVMKDYSQ